MAQGKVTPVKARIKANPFDRSGRSASSSRPSGKKKPAKTSRTTAKSLRGGSAPKASQYARAGKGRAGLLTGLLPRVAMPRVKLPRVVLPRALKQWLGAAVVLVLVGSSLWMLYPAFAQRMAQRRQMDRLEQELAGAKNQNSDLRYEIKRLHTKTFVEEIARSDLGLIKAGEIPYLVVPVKPKPKPRPTPKSKQRPAPARTGRLAKASRGSSSDGPRTAPAATQPSTQASMASAPGGAAGRKSGSTGSGGQAGTQSGGIAGWWVAVKAWLESLLE